MSEQIFNCLNELSKPQKNTFDITSDDLNLKCKTQLVWKLIKMEPEKSVEDAWLVLKFLKYFYVFKWINFLILNKPNFD